MSRPGITYTEVSEAANQLLGQGRNPTIEQIRLVLGTGSSTTIANHLKIWRDNQSETSLLSAKENIPDELVAIVKGLWDRIIMLSDEKLKTITTNYQISLNDIQIELDKYRHNNQRWQHLFQQWNKERDGLLEEESRLEMSVHVLKKDKNSLENQLALLKQQLSEKQDRNNELHQLHQQLQKNLEDFQKSVSEQRHVDQQQFLAQKHELRDEIKALIDENNEMRQKMVNIKHEHRILENEHHLLKEKYISQDELLLVNTDQLKKSQNELNLQIQSTQHWQERYHENQDAIKTLINESIQLQTDLKSSQQKNSTLEQSQIESAQIIAKLNQEILQLTRDKSMAEGQLRHFITIPA